MIAITSAGSEDILRGIAAVAWPTVVLVGIVMFRTQLRDLIKRIRKGKVPGLELELDKSLDALEKEVETVDIPEVPTREPTTTSEANAASPSESMSDVEQDIQEILTLSATSSKAALMQVAATLERDGRRILAASGHLGELRPGASLRQIAEILERATTMQRGSLDAFRNFATVRNQIVHGHETVSNDEVMRAIDSGIVLLRSLAATPRERNVVYDSGVPIFGDENLTEQLPGFAVILETTSPGGAVVQHRIYPTTRTHFAKGMEVAWEWSGEHSWGAAWYVNPDSGHVETAWSGSMEFVGRDLNEV